MKRLQKYTGFAVALFVAAFVFVPVTNAQTVPKFVSLGDSFSSGNGADIVPGQAVGNTSVYDPATNNATNQCLRSSKSYAPLLATEKGYALTQVACSGATTDNILSVGQFNEAPQISAVTPDTQLVTLTIGGNDVGFVPLVACVVTTSCTTSSPEIVNTYAQLNTLPQKITNVLNAIKANAPNAQIRIAGYPQIVPTTNSNAVGCQPWLAKSEQTLANTIEQQLNGILQTAATQAGSTVKYIDPFASTSPFMQRDLVGLTRDACSLSAARAINGIRADFMPANFHPNILGHRAYQQLFSASI
ncbi:MAG: SGNH/GDSL hydrolase family protein [Chloroflexi bacterium]|nr:MAG: SGNH/GDSL hydrolase family protein [Chloroflexota bacterium]